MTRVAVLDPGMGNLRSVARALEAAGAEVVVTPDPDAAAEQDALCVPGQGIFGRCIEAISSSGADDLIRTWLADDRPFLGICLGMQILFDGSDENPDVPGLGIFAGRAERLPGSVTVPHIGWNTVDEDYFYFDHSFAVMPGADTGVTGWCEHGVRFAARIDRGRAMAVQFHPEKSSRVGRDLLQRWLRRVA